MGKKGHTSNNNKHNNNNNKSRNDTLSHNEKKKLEEATEREKMKQAKEEKQQKRQNKKKKNYEKISSNSEDIAFNNFLHTEYQLSILTMRGDGNCLFRSISHQLSDFKNQEDHMSIRHDVVRYMKKHEDYFKLFLDEDEEDFDSYIDEMNTFGTWGGHLELYAAAQCFQLSIHVYQWNAPKYVIQCDPENNADGKPLRIIQLSFHGGCHYNSVVPLAFLQSNSSTAIDESTAPSLYVKVESSESSAMAMMIAQIERSVHSASRAEVEMALEMTDNNVDDSIDLLCTNLESIQLVIEQKLVEEASRKRQEELFRPRPPVDQPLPSSQVDDLTVKTNPNEEENTNKKESKSAKNKKDPLKGLSKKERRQLEKERENEKKNKNAEANNPPTTSSSSSTPAASSTTHSSMREIVL